MGNFFKDLKNIKRNYNLVRENPYASLKFQYMIYVFFMVTILIVLTYQFVKMFMRFRAGSGVMAIVGSILMLLIMVVVFFTTFNQLSILHRTMKQYDKKPSESKEFKKVDVASEVDEILNHFGEKDEKKK